MNTIEKQNLAKDVYTEAQKSLVNYRYVVLHNDPRREVKSASFHYDISKALLQGKSNEAIEAFRESAKSSYVLRSFPLYRITYPVWDQSYIVIVANNKTRARERLSDIEREFDSNPLIRPNVKEVYSQSSDRFCLDVVDYKGEIINILIVAAGKGENIRGLASLDRRPDILIADDLQDKEDSRSDIVLERDWKWWNSDIEFIGKNTRIFLIGNNLGERCIVERVIENAPENGYNARRIPVLDDQGEPTWPAMYTKDFIEQEKAKYIAEGNLDLWLMERMCLSVSAETRAFKEEWYNYYSPSATAEVIEGCNIYMTLDPASSRDTDACFRAFTIIAVDAKDNWFVLDMPFGRWDTVELIEIMFEQVKKWRLPDVGIEKGMYQQVLEPVLKQEMARKQAYFNIVELEHARLGTKLERIKALQPRFKAGRIWFPEERDDNRDWLCEIKSELAGVTRSAIKSKFIDLVDSLCMHCQGAEAPYDDDSQDIRDQKSRVTADTAFRGEKVPEGQRQAIAW